MTLDRFPEPAGAREPDTSGVRYLFLSAFLANVALAIASWVILPDRVAIHFCVGGKPDNWASNQANTLLFLGLDLLLFVFLYFIPRITHRIPARLINLPNKEYWLREENRTRLDARLTVFMWEFGAAIFLFLFVAGGLALLANRSDPVRLNEGVFLAALALFLGYTVVWVIRFYRGFRVPAGVGLNGI